MELGLLPALGGSIGELKQSGQDSRLIDGYLRPYAEAFDRVWYFSYRPEALADYTDDPRLLASVELLATRRAWPRLLRAVALPLVHRAALRRCAVLRVFQVTGVIPALLARALWGVPYVTTYGFWYARLSRPGPSRPAKRFLERIGLRLAAGVIVPTEELRAHVAALTPPERVHLIPNGVDTRRFAPSARSSPPEGRGETILYVGRLEAEKNLATLVTAAAKLAARVPPSLSFVGAGSLEGELRAQAAGLGVPLDLPGVVDYRRLPERYREADVFVLPSFTEGHPKVLIEAMAAGLPCVASDCPGNRALVADGETGILFEPRSPEALAAALERVLGDPSLASRLGRAARERAVRDYDLGVLVAREIRLLKQIAGAGRR